MKYLCQNEGENEIHEHLSFGRFLRIQFRVSIPYCLYGKMKERERGNGVRTCPGRGGAKIPRFYCI